MGAFVGRPQTPIEVLYHLNSRFAPGPALQEMVANQKKFKVFSKENSLKHSYQLLNLGPADFNERALHHRFLDYLTRVPSDLPGVNGHDRIIRARQENLESAKPLPMHTTTHRAADDPRVTVTQGHPWPHDDQPYVIISTPTRPPEPSTPPAGPKRAVRKKAAATPSHPAPAAPPAAPKRSARKKSAR